MIDDIAKNLPAPEMVIVGEPTDMRIINGHKGCYLFETRVKGQAAHSSQPHHGGNAILAAGRLIAFLAEMAQDKRRSAPPDSPFDPPYTTFNLGQRSEEHTSELQSLMRISYAVFCLKTKITTVELSI